MLVGRLACVVLLLALPAELVARRGNAANPCASKKCKKQCKKIDKHSHDKDVIHKEFELAQEFDVQAVSVEPSMPTLCKKGVNKPAMGAPVNVQANQQLMEEGLYKGVSGFRAQKEGSEFTYGEIKPESLQTIIDDNQFGPQDVFIDFGCGVGKVVVQVYLNTNIKKAIGVELCKERYDDAQAIVQKMKEQGLIQMGRDIEFLQDNMLNVSLQGVTKGFMCATCFGPELMHNIMKKMAQEASIGFTLFTLKELPADYAQYGFERVEPSYSLAMTWSAASPVHRYVLARRPVTISEEKPAVA